MKNYHSFNVCGSVLERFPRMPLLHALRSCASSPLNFIFLMLSAIHSLQVFLPLPLSPATVISLSASHSHHHHIFSARFQRYISSTFIAQVSLPHISTHWMYMLIAPVIIFIVVNTFRHLLWILSVYCKLYECLLFDVLFLIHILCMMPSRLETYAFACAYVAL